MTRLSPIMLAAIGVALPRTATAMADVNTKRVVEITITDGGPSPAQVKASPGEHLRLAITRKTESTCAKELLVNGIERRLPRGEAVLVDVTPRTSGEIRIACGTGMSFATIEVK